MDFWTFVENYSFVFILQWVAFVPSYIFKTAVAYDLVGCGTYTLISLYYLFNSKGSDSFEHKKIVNFMMLAWSFRLTCFLFWRALQRPDSRFKVVKTKFLMFFVYWTVQAVWIIITSSGVTSMNILTKHQHSHHSSIFTNILFYFGCFLWAFGNFYEAIADLQKTIFNMHAKKPEPFITSGLWKYSRHPNYFGEILLWIGSYLATASVLLDYDHYIAALVTVISPIFTYVLLAKVSGIPILTKKLLKEPGYGEYMKKTNALIPNFSQK